MLNVFKKITNRIERSHSYKNFVINGFHKLYYNTASQTIKNTKWLGRNVYKFTTDLWIYQEILFETKPDLIIECGTSHGGSALYLATLCDILGRGRVATIDVTKREGHQEHPRIQYFLGSSADQQIFTQIKNLIHGNEKVMVILDSDHHKDHVQKEMELYGPLVTKGCYMIVEDSNIGGHPVRKDFGPGPMEALLEYVGTHKDFGIDRSREKLFLTQNPSGYLLKIN